MYLHENKADFVQISAAAAEALNQPVLHVVKDYYVTMMLKEIFARNKQLVFKGGTALSKCYGIIRRFSEDIDLGIEEENATQGQRKRIKKAVVDAAGVLGLEINNIEKTRSRRDFNRYELPLPEDYSGSAVANTLFIETSILTPIAPSTRRPISSLIENYLRETGRDELIKEYFLDPFEVRVTSLARSLCDKVYAICDYYLEEKDLQKPSRHVYDIHKLLSVVPLDDDFRALFTKVGLERRASALRCSSANEWVDLAGVLKDVANKGVYRLGYENTTLRLLDASEDVPYDAAIESVRRMAGFLGPERNY